MFRKPASSSLYIPSRTRPRELAVGCETQGNTALAQDVAWTLQSHRSKVKMSKRRRVQVS